MVGTLAPFDAIAHERQQGCVLLLRRTEKRKDMAVATKRRTSKGDRFTRRRHNTFLLSDWQRNPEGSCWVYPQSVEQNRAIRISYSSPLPYELSLIVLISGNASAGKSILSENLRPHYARRESKRK